MIVSLVYSLIILTGLIVLVVLVHKMAFSDVVQTSPESLVDWMFQG